MPLFTLPMISFIVACFVVVSSVHAAQTVPYKMNFQGRLTNSSGTALSGSYDMELRLYSAVTGGTYLWGESRTAANSNAVTVTNGLFSVLIGDSADTTNATVIAGGVPGTLQGAITSGENVFLEVKVGGETMNARTRIAASGFAINSDMVDGIDGSAIAQLGVANTFTTGQTVSAASANAFQVKNSTNLFNVDTTNSIITLGVSDTTGSVLVLDVKSGSGDPTGLSAVVGAMYYNSNASKFRCYQNTGWTDCITTIPTNTLQTDYTASTGGTTPMVKVSSAKGAVTIQDADTTVNGELFSVNQSNASNIGTDIFSVSSTGAFSLGLASATPIFTGTSAGAVSLGIAGQTTTLAGSISSTGTFSSTGATALFKPSSSAANAFQIQNSSSLAFLSADTSASIVRIGSSNGADATVLLVLDSTTGSGVDPTGVNGGSYYNSTNNKFRCYQNSIWQDCGNGFNTITKTSDQIATQNSTTFQNDTALFFAVKANTTYVFDAWIPVNDSNGTPDLKYTFTTPTGATQNIFTSYYSAATTSVQCNIITSGQTCANTTVNRTDHFIQVRGQVTVSTTAGTVQFQFAQNTATAVAFPIVKKGATISWHQSN